MKILAIIPARGASKGIPHKNIAEINGYPMIKYSIDVANQAVNKGIIEEAIVSTDDLKIVEIAKALGAKVPFVRPKELAMDTSKSIGFVLHALDYYKKCGRVFEAVMILQPTSPLRCLEDIEKSVELFQQNESDSLISCSLNTSFNSLGAYFVEDGEVKPLDSRHNLGIRRQDYPELYVRNGAVFLTKVKYLEEKKLIISDKPLIYRMPIERAANIDMHTAVVNGHGCGAERPSCVA